MLNAIRPVITSYIRDHHVSFDFCVFLASYSRFVNVFENHRYREQQGNEEPYHRQVTLTIFLKIPPSQEIKYKR